MKAAKVALAAGALAALACVAGLVSFVFVARTMEFVHVGTLARSWPPRMVTRDLPAMVESGAMVGMYRLVSEGAKPGRHCMVTVNGDVYLFSVEGAPSYKAKIGDIAGDFDGVRFESGDIRCDKIGVDAVTRDSVRMLALVNEAALRLRQRLDRSRYNIEVEPRLDRPDFNTGQIEVLDWLAAEPSRMHVLMTDIVAVDGVKTLVVNDYTNRQLIAKHRVGKLCAGFTRKKERRDALKAAVLEGHVTWVALDERSVEMAVD